MPMIAREAAGSPGSRRPGFPATGFRSRKTLAAKPTMARTVVTRYPRFSAFMGSSSSRHFTVKTPTMVAMRPKARARRGKRMPPMPKTGIEGDARGSWPRRSRPPCDLEEVGPAARAVAHVVAHEVGDHGGVPGIVLGDARFHLAHEVGAHVGGLGVDAAARAGRRGPRSWPRSRSPRSAGARAGSRRCPPNR